MSRLALFTIVLSLCVISAVQAKQFKNSYISFNIPDRWNCVLEATEWVCRSQDVGEAKEAIIVLTAKEIGPSDTFAIYNNYLKNPIMAKGNTGTSTPSQVVSQPVVKKIQNLDWIDGFHLGSEIPNYYTRYVATLKENVAVLVTFSAHKEFYTKYATDFFNAINTLSVHVTKNSIIQPMNSPQGRLDPIPSLPDGDPVVGLGTPEVVKPKNNKLILIIAAVVCALIGLILFVRNRKK